MFLKGHRFFYTRQIQLYNGNTMKKLILSILLTTILAAGIFAAPVYVCVGSFVNIDNAMALADRLKNDDEDVCITEFLRDDGTLFYRVLLNTNSDDMDRARQKADSAILKGAFIYVPKADEKITIVHKAANAPSVPAPNPVESVPAPSAPVTSTPAASTPAPSVSAQTVTPATTAPAVPAPAVSSSPITLKSGAKKIISSIADMGVFAFEAGENMLGRKDTTELEELENLLEYFEDLIDSDEIENSKSGRLVTAAVKSVMNKLDNCDSELHENKKTVITVDENIASDFSDIVPGLKVKTLYLKGNGEATPLYDKENYLYGLKGKASAAAVIDYTFDLTELPYKTFIRQMKGTVTAKAAAAGTISEKYIELPSAAAVTVRQEIALCNSKGRGGVVLLEGNIALKGTLTDYYLELLDSGNLKEMARALDDICTLNLTLNIFDDNGKLYYMSSLNSFETIAVFLDELDRLI